MQTAMMRRETVVGEEVVRFMEEHVDNPTKLELLFFWSRHPKTRFTLRTITGFINGIRPSEIERNLESLTNSGLVSKWMPPSGGILYGIAGVYEVQAKMVELAKCSRYDLNYCFRSLGKR